MLRKPVLARCDDRSCIAQQNKLYGGPEDWLTSGTLAHFGVAPLSFDFFIDWSTNRLQPELWVKRISDRPVEQLGPADIYEGALACGDDLSALQAFADRHKFDVRYVVFRDGVDWQRGHESILVATLRAGRFDSVVLRSLAEVENDIRRYSGGPVNIGNKGLTYGTSTLECHLAKHSNALWPGDVDCVLWDTRKGTLAVLEFKKHNLDTPIADEHIQKYMDKDARKWRRLAMLRDWLGSEVVLACVYYSTRAGVNEVKVEVLSGQAPALRAMRSSVINIAGLNHEEIGQVVMDAV